MRAPPTIALVAALLAAGCLGAGHAEDAGGAAPMDAAPVRADALLPRDIAKIPTVNLTHEMLSQGRVVLAPQNGTWLAVRLVATDDLWGPQPDYTPDGGGTAWLRLGLVVSMEADSQAYLLSASWFERDSSAPFLSGLAFDEPIATGLGIGYGCAAGCDDGFPRAEIVVAFGVLQGNATLSIGKTGSFEPQEQYRVADRKRLPVVPDAWGYDGAAGSYARTVTTSGTDVETAGMLNVTFEEPTTGPVAGATVGQRLLLEASHEMPRPGLFYAGLSSWVTGGAQSHSWQIDLSDQSFHDQRTWVDPVPRAAAPGPAGEAIGVGVPAFRTQLRTTAGPATISLERTLTGAEAGENDVVEFNWLWLDQDLAQKFGWPWHDDPPAADQSESPAHLDGHVPSDTAEWLLFERAPAAHASGLGPG